MRGLRVSLGDRSYPVLVGKGLLERAGSEFTRAGFKSRQVVVVTQAEIPEVYLDRVLRSLSREHVEHSVFLIPKSKSSEAAKSQAMLGKLIRHMASHDGKNRSVALAALGGGVIGDLTGFAAAVYRRGVPYLQLPTTLTAQVDSAIGGKTAVDLPEGKNLLGTIYQPFAVLCDTSALDTLPDRHWSDGFAEVIKYGVIRDAGLFRLLEKEGLAGTRRSSLERVILACARIKARLVERDEFDKKGERIVLNFGHTAGHGIEAASSFSRRYTHGEAVGIGMLVACDLGARLGTLRDAELPKRLEQTLVKFNLPVFYRGLTPEAILKAMGYDKKAEGGVNRFILPVSLGKTAVVKGVPAEEIRAALLKRKA